MKRPKYYKRKNKKASVNERFKIYFLLSFAEYFKPLIIYYNYYPPKELSVSGVS